MVDFELRTKYSGATTKANILLGSAETSLEVSIVFIMPLNGLAIHFSLFSSIQVYPELFKDFDFIFKVFIVPWKTPFVKVSIFSGITKQFTLEFVFPKAHSEIFLTL